jgi:glycosyltransferase involved in cell wall biosynthesis
MPAELLYRQLHAYVTKNGTDHENWPRVGLEAMAYGVPIVAERAFGWKEMVTEGETGLLGATDADMARCATRLAQDEPFRLNMAQRARERLERDLAQPEVLWRDWQQVL